MGTITVQRNKSRVSGDQLYKIRQMEFLQISNTYLKSGVWGSLWLICCFCQQWLDFLIKSIRRHIFVYFCYKHNNLLMIQISGIWHQFRTRQAHVVWNRATSYYFEYWNAFNYLIRVKMGGGKKVYFSLTALQ
jgi:hypothetical protein